MNFRAKKAWLSAGLAAVIVSSTMPVSGDTHFPLTSSTHQFQCYCQCEKHGGHSACPMKMCEIPKYEKRWWATSCHKHASDSSSSSAPVPQPSGRHTRNIIDAKR